MCLPGSLFVDKKLPCDSRTGLKDSFVELTDTDRGFLREGTVASTSTMRVGIRQLEMSRRLRDCFRVIVAFYNPSVSLCASHLPLHKGGFCLPASAYLLTTECDGASEKKVSTISRKRLTPSTSRLLNILT